MASTNKTPNYDLSQYIGTDKPTYLGDYNSDMSKIDTAIKNNENDISSATNIVDGLNTRVDTLETTANTHTQEITNINSVLSGLLPIGTIVPFAGSVIPDKWLECDGRAVSRETYSDLYDVISVYYGVGDGATTFNIPNLKGRIPVGHNPAETEFDVIGEIGGGKTHYHIMPLGFDNNGYLYGKADADNNPYYGSVIETVSNRISYNPINYQQNVGIRIAYTSDGNSLQPYITMKYIIKAII